MQTVIISSWRRAEYLTLCLQTLSKARGIENKKVMVFQNDRRDAGVDLRPVHVVLANAFDLFPHFQVVTTNYVDNGHPGWVWAHYDAFALVHDLGAERIYFLSDDNVVTPDFFEWHDAVHADGDWFASSAWRNVEGSNKPFDLEAYYQIGLDEVAHGFAVNREHVPELLSTPPFWCNPEHWEAQGKKIVKPYVQRVYHIGRFNSYLTSIEPNDGPSVDKMPDQIPDYGKQRAILK